MIGGTLGVLGGTALGLISLSAFLSAGRTNPLLLLPSLALSLGGGYAVLFPAIAVSRNGVRICRDWRQHPRAARLLWILSLGVAGAGLAICIAAGAANPQAPGLLVWLFMGIYLALTGWASALMGAAEGLRQGAPDAGRATAPAR